MRNDIFVFKRRVFLTYLLNGINVLGQICEKYGQHLVHRVSQLIKV